MTHKHFYHLSKKDLIKKINFTLKINYDICSNSELNGYTKKQFKYINKCCKIHYKNIHLRNNPYYICKY